MAKSKALEAARKAAEEDIKAQAGDDETGLDEDGGTDQGGEEAGLDEDEPKKPGKKPASKKAPTKKSGSKKPSSKETPAKKSANKKPADKKTPAKKSGPKADPINLDSTAVLFDVAKLTAKKNPMRKIAGDAVTFDALKKSMAKNGLFQSIIINRNHEILIGTRRHAAAKALGWKKIRATVLDANIPDDVAEWQANETAEAVHILDKARIVQEYLSGKRKIPGKKKRPTTRELAERLMTSQSMIVRFDKLKDLTKAEQKAVIEGQIAPRAMMDLMAADDDLRKELRKEAMSRVKSGKKVTTRQVAAGFKSAKMDKAALPNGITGSVGAKTSKVTISFPFNMSKGPQFDKGWKWLIQQKPKLKEAAKLAGKEL